MINISRELAVRIEQILTGGHWAEAWAPTIAELQELLTQQHQREPVALPERDADGPGPWNDGWNACLDEIAKLGPLYAHPAPAQVGPIGVVRESADRGYQVRWTQGGMQSLRDGLHLYTHADAGEVESLRAELAELKERCQRNNDQAMEWMRKHDALRDQLAVIDRKATEYACQSIPTGRECRFGDEIAALSASAEPSTPVCDIDPTGSEYRADKCPEDLDIKIDDVTFVGNNADGSPYLRFALGSDGQRVLKAIRLVGVTIKGTVMANTEVSGTGHYLASEETLSGHDTND